MSNTGRFDKNNGNRRNNGNFRRPPRPAQEREREERLKGVK